MSAKEYNIAEKTHKRQRTDLETKTTTLETDFEKARNKTRAGGG